MLEIDAEKWLALLGMLFKMRAAHLKMPVFLDSFLLESQSCPFSFSLMYFLHTLISGLAIMNLQRVVVTV